MKKVLKKLGVAAACLCLTATTLSSDADECVAASPHIKMYTTDTVNLREEATTESKVITTFSCNTKIKALKEDVDNHKEWIRILYKKKYRYIKSDYISKKKMKYKQYEVPKTSGFKSWMPHALRSGRSIFCKSSPQYKLQQQAYTGTYGIRQVQGRYCAALGSYFGVTVGQFFDLVLENGTVIKCIMGDEKADKDTDSSNIVTTHSGCMSEFIVDSSSLAHAAKRDGDVSSCSEKWKSPVKKVLVYKTNLLK